MLEIDLSHFRVRQKMLAHSLSFSVPPRKIHALTGPNGCGKTLLLDAISGIGDATGVRCRLDKLDLNLQKPWQRWRSGIRRLFQHPVLPQTLTVNHILKETGVAALDHTIELLRTTGVPTTARMSELSFGQARLVEICTTAGTSKAILLDEPFAGLSPSYRPAVIGFIERCAELGPAVLCIDHLHSSNTAMYHDIHRWPSPIADGHSFSNGSRGAEVLPDTVIADRSVAGARASWVVSRLEVNSRVIARDFALTLEPGSIGLIIGSNGSGKSTLARALARMPQPSSSFIASVESALDSHNLIFSPQPPKLVPELSIRDNLALMINRCFRLSASSVSEIGELLTWLRGDKLLLTTLAGNISGGEASLCALVGAVASLRGIVILDEALEGLAPRTCERASILLKRAARRGQSFVVTTHVATSTALLDYPTLDLDSGTPLFGKVHFKST